MTASNVAAVTFAASLFDFNDMSDLPEEMAKKLTADNDEQVRTYSALVAAAGRPVSITEIIAAATRAKLDPPTPTTVRKYLNDAADRKLIVKPSRQTYAGPGVVVEAAAEAEEEVQTEDPLAAALA